MAAELTTATAKFVGLDGAAKRAVLIISQEGGPLPVGDGGYVMDQDPMVVQADENGDLSVQLVRGSKIVVAVEGTTYVRSFTVPDVNTFDLLQVMSDVADHFAIQTLPPLVSRRSI